MGVAAIDRRALADMFPLFLAAIPFGFVVGLEITKSPIPDGIGWASSLLIFAGAAQLAVITLVATTSLWAAALAGIVINARHVMYSAALAPAFQSQPRWMRWLGPYVLIDQVFALAVVRARDDPAVFRRYYLTIGVAFLVGWNVVVALGLVIGPVVPESWRLDFAPGVMFAGMVVTMCVSNPRIVSAIVGAGGCLVAIELPNRVGILVGAGAGIVAGALAERRTTDEEPTERGARS